MCKRLSAELRESNTVALTSLHSSSKAMSVICCAGRLGVTGLQCFHHITKPSFSKELRGYFLGNEANKDCFILVAWVEAAGSLEMLTSSIVFNRIHRCLATCAHKFDILPEYFTMALQILQPALPYLVLKPKHVHASDLDATGDSCILSCSAVATLSMLWMYTTSILTRS